MSEFILPSSPSPQQILVLISKKSIHPCALAVHLLIYFPTFGVYSLWCPTHHPFHSHIPPQPYLHHTVTGPNFVISQCLLSKWMASSSFSCYLKGPGEIMVHMLESPPASMTHVPLSPNFTHITWLLWFFSAFILCRPKAPDSITQMIIRVHSYIYRIMELEEILGDPICFLVHKIRNWDTGVKGFFSTSLVIFVTKSELNP